MRLGRPVGICNHVFELGDTRVVLMLLCIGLLRAPVGWSTKIKRFAVLANI